MSGVAGLIPPHLLEQIRAASDIVDVVGSYLPLKRAGANFVALCPFHREKSPSFNVNPHRQIFHCFGCHKGGDVFTFVREYENISFMEAVRRLAERAKIPLEFENTPGAQQARHIKQVLWTIHEQITQRWHAALLNEASGQIARDYLARRGVAPDAIKLFRLGSAPDAWDDTVNWATSKGHELPVVEQAGLIIRKEGSDRYYDRFRGRLIFPICDEQSRVIGFSGRVLSGDEKTAKYVNSPETPIFTKGKVFFGLDKSKRALLDAESAIVCEGQLDLIACYMAGVQNIVAPQGTALTADHARILKRYVEEVVLCFDSDTAGQNATVRSLDSLLIAGLAVRVATVPAPHDPDSFIKEHGGEAFRALIDAAEGFFDYYLMRLCATHDIKTDKGRLGVIRDLGEALAKAHNAVLSDTYAQKCALRLGVAAESVRAELKKLRSASPREEASAGPEDEVAVAAPSPHESQLLKVLLTAEEYVPFVAAHLQVEWLQNPIVQRIVRRRLDAHVTESWQSGAAFFSAFEEDPAAQALLSATLADQRPIPQPDKQIADVLTHLRNDFISRQLRQLTHQLSHPDTPDEQRLDLLQQQQALRALKSRPLAV